MVFLLFGWEGNRDNCSLRAAPTGDIQRRWVLSVAIQQVLLKFAQLLEWFIGLLSTYLFDFGSFGNFVQFQTVVSR